LSIINTEGTSKKRNCGSDDSESDCYKERGKDKNPNFTRKVAKGVLLFKVGVN